MTPNRIAAVLFILFGLIYGYYTFYLPTATISGEPSAALFPWILTFSILGLSLVLLIQESANKSNVRIAIRLTPDMLRVGGGLLLVLVYLMAIPYLGFIISTVAFFPAVMWMGGERRYLRILLFSLLVPIALFYLFREIFQIPIPQWGIFRGVF